MKRGDVPQTTAGSTDPPPATLPAVAWHGQPWSPSLVEAVASGLRPTRRTALGMQDIAEVLRQASLDRLQGLLASAVSERVIDWPAEASDDLRRAHLDALTASVEIERRLVILARHFDKSEIRWRLLKGAALAHLDYPRPELRQFGDIDVLIHPHDWRGAGEVMTQLGFIRPAAELVPGFDIRFAKGATFVLAERNDIEVDAHLRLAEGRFGARCQAVTMFEAAPGHIALGGRQIPVLPGHLRLLHACFHEALGGFRGLRAMSDVARLALADSTSRRWTDTVATAQDWRVEAVIAAAVNETWITLQLDSDHGNHPFRRWAASYRMTSGDKRGLHIMQHSSSYRRQVLSSFPTLRGADRLRFVNALWQSARKPPNR